MTQLTLRRFRVVGFIGVVVGVGVARADEPGTVAPGPRVRLTAPSVSIERLVGTLVGLDETALTLQRKGAKDTLRVPRGAITTIETSAHRSRKGRGAAIGALAGLGAGVALGLAIGENCGELGELEPLFSPICFSKGEMAAVAALLAVPAGALVGLAVAPGEKWQRSALDRLTVRIRPARGGAALTVSLRF